jgi:hypothetical protein
VALYVVDELDVLLPDEFVPCQYQVTADGGSERVKVFEPQVLDETDGVAGCDGVEFTDTNTVAEDKLQQPEVVFFARRL